VGGGLSQEAAQPERYPLCALFRVSGFCAPAGAGLTLGRDELRLLRGVGEATPGDAWLRPEARCVARFERKVGAFRVGDVAVFVFWDTRACWFAARDLAAGLRTGRMALADPWPR
jgi:hypothetical protein